MGDLLLIRLIRKVKLIHRVNDEVKDNSADNRNRQRIVGDSKGIRRAKIHSHCAKDGEG